MEHPAAVGFGPFLWDETAAELRRNGSRVRLPRQPAEILKRLLAVPGRVVTREDLRRRLWGDETFVDFEQGLNTAVARLRQALGDSAEAPRYVETVPGQGYRFVAPVHGSAADPRTRAGADRGVGRRAWVAGALGAAGGAAAAYLLGTSRAPSPPSRGRFALSTPPAPPLQLTPLFPGVAVAPGGDFVVYACHREGRAALYIRPIHETEGRYLQGSELHSPFFSPDGTEVGCYRFGDQALLRAPSLGGGAAVIASGVGVLEGAAWSPRGEILFGTRFPHSGLMRVAVTGGTPVPVTRPAVGETHGMPELLPGGRAALFTILPESGSAAPQVAVVDLDSGEQRTLLPGSSPRYAAPGHLAFVLEDRLMAVGFDSRALAVRGAPVRVLDGLAVSRRGLGQYALSRSGALVLAVPGSDAARELVWVSRAAGEEPLPTPARGFTYPRVSPDGRRVAVDARDAQGSDILIWDVARERLRHLTPPSSISIYPAWSPDGGQIAYWSDGPPSPGLFRRASDGSAEAEVWSEAAELRAPYFFTPSGRALVFARQRAAGVELCQVGGDGAVPQLLLEGARNADLSPDGRRIAYQSDADGRFQVYVRSFTSLQDGFHQVSTRGGIQPLWSPSGSELFYVEPGPPARLMSVAAVPGSAPGRPRAILDWPYLTGVLGRTYDISRPDGDRFLAVKEREPAGVSARVEIVLDWQDALGALL
jgi:serine/threonine-protein kinase